MCNFKSENSITPKNDLGNENVQAVWKVSEVNVSNLSHLRHRQIITFKTGFIFFSTLRYNVCLKTFEFEQDLDLNPNFTACCLGGLGFISSPSEGSFSHLWNEGKNTWVSGWLQRSGALVAIPFHTKVLQSFLLIIFLSIFYMWYIPSLVISDHSHFLWQMATNSITCVYIYSTNIKPSFSTYLKHLTWYAQTDQV